MILDSHASAAKQPLYRRLYVQVVAAIALGVVFGHFYPSLGADMKPLGDGFRRSRASAWPAPTSARS